MRRSLSSVGCLTLFSSVLVVGPLSITAQADFRDGGDGSGGISWQYSKTATAYWREPHSRESSGDGGGPATVYMQYGPAGRWLECPKYDDAFACGEDGGGLTTLLCGSEEVGPNGLPEFAWIRYEREIRPNGEPTKWVGEDGGCSEPSEDDFVSMEEISTEIDYSVFQPLGDPDVSVHPGGRTLVNLPTIVSTSYPEGVGAPAELLSLEEARVRIPIDIEKPGENLTGEIIAQADFVWRFEGAGTATGRGRPYVEGKTPQNSPGYYTTGTFTDTGSRSISLTATWTGEVTVETLAPEEIEPVVRESTVELEVVESRARLSDN